MSEHPPPVLTETTRNALRTMLDTLDGTTTEREALYREFHEHPELSMQEHETAGRIARELERMGIEYTWVGETGIVATLVNGQGPTVAFRADIDGLPVKETDRSPHPSRATQVDKRSGIEHPTMHACGHDFHLTALIQALQLLADHRDLWSGTFHGVFQPAEETAEGARSLIKEGIGEIIGAPDVYLGQHVMPFVPGGTVGTLAGPIMSQAFSARIVLHGHGSHGSMPELSVDPVVLASTIVVRLQSVVAREIPPAETAVLTVGSIRSGTKSNVIPGDAELLVNTRAYNPAVSEALKEAIERIVRAECRAARCPAEPEFHYSDFFPLTDNDPRVTSSVSGAFRDYFGRRAIEAPRVAGSEDFSAVPTALGVPYTYWFYGGFAEDSPPANHSADYVPDLHPTLEFGTELILVACTPWLMA